MRREELDLLSRKDLQLLAKEHGLKANKKSVDLIQELLMIFSQQQESVVEVKQDDIQVNSSLSIEEKNSGDTNFTARKVESYHVSDKIQFELNSCTSCGIIKRVNKLSVRVVLDDGSEFTIPNSDIQGLVVPLVQEETSTHSNEAQISIIEMSEPSLELEEIKTAEIVVENISDSLAETISDNHPSTICDHDLPPSQSGIVSSIDDDDDQLHSDVIENACENVAPFATCLHSPGPGYAEDMSMNVCNESAPIESSDHQLFLPITPKMKGEARRRSSLLKSTKAQRARAEAIALKQERLSVACSNTQLSFPKSPYPVQRSQESRVSHVFKKGSDSFYRSASTSRATITPSLGSTLKKTKTVPSMRASVGVSSPIPDKIARIKEAKEKANNYLRSNSKCAKKVPNFQKLHEQSFNKQKSITTIVKENKDIQLKMTDAMKSALQTPEKVSNNAVTTCKMEECRSVVKNPFEVIIAKNDENNPTALNTFKPKQSMKSRGITQTQQTNRREKFHKEGKSLRENQMNISRGVRC